MLVWVALERLHGNDPACLCGWCWFKTFLWAQQPCLKMYVTTESTTHVIDNAGSPSMLFQNHQGFKEAHQLTSYTGVLPELLMQDVSLRGILHNAVRMQTWYVLCLSTTPYEILIHTTSNLKSHAIIPASRLMLSTMLLYMNVRSVISAGLTGVHTTGCSAETRLVLLVPSSSWAATRFNSCYRYYLYIHYRYHYTVYCCTW